MDLEPHPLTVRGEGERVRAGQLLLRLDDAQAVAAVAEARHLGAPAVFLEGDPG